MLGLGLSLGAVGGEGLKFGYVCTPQNDDTDDDMVVIQMSIGIILNTVPALAAVSMWTAEETKNEEADDFAPATVALSAKEEKNNVLIFSTDYMGLDIIVEFPHIVFNNNNGTSSLGAILILPEDRNSEETLTVAFVCAEAPTHR